jgi:membrane fusion protein, multidrug efflux system
VIVPKTAIKRDMHGSYVFALTDADSAEKSGVKTPAGAYRAKRMPVILGAERDFDIVLSSGVEPGVLIASKGAYKLRDGILVYVAATGSKEG